MSRGVAIGMALLGLAASAQDRSNARAALVEGRAAATAPIAVLQPGTAQPTLAPPSRIQGPAAFRGEALPRPRLRPFAAQGPLLARVSDEAFRPRARPVEALFRPQARPGDLLLPDPPRTLAGASDLVCIAVAIYHEARDQPLDGQLAVASVILNRAALPDRWGGSPCAVITPGQFSFLTGWGTFPPIEDREAWAIAVEMAREALERGPSPLVGRADHYHTPAVHPRWGRDMVRVIQIDDHIFYAEPTGRG
ncbi:hypothetical protein Rumeso_00976 [Rubellimicrobium mesophilum DSM 19309]|uniref:Cell wall hydrolase SleB domain-containing protein n=2 Tax=Rubellimicrobium TaxID=295418 RepID=A0A017HSF2_9RHOB|nr:hypothetical protein Rumeso_00976 [Rubellimicrobium mesophilum DSM 19309]